MNAMSQEAVEWSLQALEERLQAPRDTSLRDFSDFYEQHYHLLLSVARSLSTRMGGFAGADDIVQDTFLVALGNWDHIGRLDNTTGYLIKVAQRLSRRAAQKIYRELPSGDMQSDGPAFEHHLTSVLADDLLDRLIRLLPPRQAEIVALDYYGFTTDDISYILGLAPATVRSHRRHAHARLRELSNTWQG